MKKCPFCAEEIQDAAIKCRFCGSMLEGSPPASLLTAASPEPAATGPIAEQPQSSSWIAIGLLVVLVVAIGALLVISRSRGSAEALPRITASPTAAATLAPSEPTQGDYQFLDLAWGSSREVVLASLKARDFSHVERDEDGDEQYQGRVDGRDAAVYAMFAANKLAKVMVIMLAPDDGGVYELARQNVAGAYGQPARQQGAAIIWPERNGSLVWVTMDATDHRTKVNYESAGWPAESRRRRGK